MNKQEIIDAIEKLQALKRYTERADSPDEFFKHMQGHITELSIALAAFDIANMSEAIISALQQHSNNGWIPVDSRLPENEPGYITGTTYIISLKNSKVKFAKYKECKWIVDFGKVISDSDVIAWQPLPEPYQEPPHE
jgi:antitoxin component of RelBE/YafQ-DinJ toxin-antitoxin module